MFTSVIFYIVWAVFALFPLAVAVFALPTVKSKIIACICALIITCGITILIFKDTENAIDRWDGGICECGGTYELSAASQFLLFKTFYYTCDTCGNTEAFSNLMN